jgi:hypothetical protein
MLKAAKVLAILAAVECFGIMALEMFFWEQAGMKIDSTMTADFLSQTVAMAANQGLYNGFLGLGIIFGMIRKNKEMILLSLFCIIIAATYGAYSVDYTIIFKQGSIPIIAFIFNLIAKEKRGTLHFR